MSSEEVIKRMKEVLDRLYSERAWKPDEMRDLAQRFHPVYDVVKEMVEVMDCV